MCNCWNVKEDIAETDMKTVIGKEDRHASIKQHQAVCFIMLMMLLCQEIVSRFSTEKSEARVSYRPSALELVVLQFCYFNRGYAC